MMKHLVLCVVLCLSFASCAKAPPNLTPQATVAFKATQVVKALDLLRDTAVTANEQTPPVLSVEDTRKVVTYHQSAVKIIQSTPAGWQQAVLTGLTELLNNLPAGPKQVLSPYVVLIKAVLPEVVR